MTKRANDTELGARGSNAALATINARAGEEVDTGALLNWLRSYDELLAPGNATCEVAQFPAGFSNLTYLVTIRADNHARRLVLRRPPLGVKAGVAHNMGREHDILAALHPMGVPVPRPIARCDSSEVIGAPFYLMEYAEGIILRNSLPEGLGTVAGSRTGFPRELSRTFVSALAQLHAIDVSTGALSKLGRPEGYVQRQVDGWTSRWQNSRTDAIESMEFLATWLNKNQPETSTASLIHNDFKFDNLVLDAAQPTTVKAILDWEMATVGDPLMDLGTTLAYWIEAADNPIFRSLGLGITALPGCMTRTELVAEYARMTGRDVGNMAFYHAFGLFKVAVIAQQIYARHVRGLTSDPRFAQLLPVIRAMADFGAEVTTDNNKSGQQQAGIKTDKNKSGQIHSNLL